MRRPLELENQHLIDFALQILRITGTTTLTRRYLLMHSICLTYGHMIISVAYFHRTG
jgi:hypothetical protein